jgi:hypothetical protein
MICFPRYLSEFQSPRRQSETGKDTTSLQPVVLSCIKSGLIIRQRGSSPSDKLPDCHEGICFIEVVSWLNIEFKFYLK